MPLNANHFPDIYDDMKLKLNQLGCIMITADNLPKIDIPEEHLYYSGDERFWINGNVSQKTPHVTLLYGLLPGVKKWHVDAVLEDWWVTELHLKNLEVFSDDSWDYYCVVVRVDVEPLLEAHQRLSLLPHINTFLDYKAHLTLAYVKKNDESLDTVLELLDDRVTYKTVPTKEIDYGGKIT